MSQQKKYLKLLQQIITVFVLFVILGIGLGYVLPDIIAWGTGLNKWDYQPSEPGVIYYADGQEMNHIGYSRIYSENFPVFLKQAVIAIEDHRFYSHKGVDLTAILRAAWRDMITGTRAEGASTITQQLSRTLFLDQEKSFSRKIKEALIALALESKFNKDQILNMYLNEIYMGRGCAGMETAAQTYFGKNINNLNEAQLCLLVAMIRAPEYYSPDNNFTELKKRRDMVADILVNQKVISSFKAAMIKKQTINILKGKEPEGYKHPYFTAYVLEQLKNELGESIIYKPGLQVYTTLDKSMQEVAESIVNKHAQSTLLKNISAKDIALVSVGTSDGQIKAMVGGVDYSRNQVNMAIKSRQPGSALKPLYYAAALNEGIISIHSRINNKSRDFGNYKPKNYKPAPEYVNIDEALIYSYNVASVEVLNALGVNRACEYLEKLDFTLLPDDRNLALALGGMSQGVSPLKMATAYTIFADKGKYKKHYCITKVLDNNDKTLYRNQVNKEQIICIDCALEMDSILKNAVQKGTASNAAIAISSGGKTGTTSDSRDLWYVGYTDDLSTAIWAGNSDGSSGQGLNLYGGSVAAPIWHDYMAELYYSNKLDKKPIDEEKNKGDISYEQKSNRSLNFKEGQNVDFIEEHAAKKNIPILTPNDELKVRLMMP